MALAFVLAAIATLLIFLYVNGLEDEKTNAATVEVVVSKDDILAGTDFNDLLDEDGFTTIEIPENAIVEGAVSRLEQLRDETASVPILKGEQITSARFAGSEDLPGGALGIPKGFEGLSIPLEGPQAAAGAISGGDRVRVMGAFPKGLNGNPVTVILVADALVLDVIGQENASEDPGAEQVVTLALKAADTPKVVFAKEEGSVWLSLLPPGEEGTMGSPIGLGQVIK